MPTIKHVLATLPETLATPQYRSLLEAAAPGARFTYADLKTLKPEQAADAQVWLGNPSIRKLNMGSELGLLQLCSAGADYYCRQAGDLPKGLRIANATGAYGIGISEYMMGTLLMLVRSLHLYRDKQSKQLWENKEIPKAVYGSTVLVVGLGDIGTEFARKCKAFGAHVIGVRRSGTQKPDFVDELHLTGELDNLLPRADYVALCLPSTPQTRGMFDAARLSRMKPDSLLINIGRGDAVDNMALLEAVSSGHLGGAALDVTDPEPLPADHPLWLEPRVIITPHCSGNYNLKETNDRIVDIICQNLGRFHRDEPLLNLVDLELGYRAL